MQEFKMCFLDENGNMVEIPENIQKFIEERESQWIDKLKDIDNKCGIVLERLALTEKALELACDKLAHQYCFIGGEGCFCVDCELCLIDYFKEQAKEMMESE